MKKTLAAIFLASTMLVLAVPIYADDKPLESCVLTRNVGVSGCDINTTCTFSANSKCGICCLLQTIYNVTDWIFVAMVALAGLLVIIGAFFLITSGGSPEKIGSGRKYIVFAAIGLLVGFLAKAVPAIVRAII